MDEESNRKTLKALKSAGKALDGQFKNKFVAIVLLGSRAKGYSSKHADVDLRLVVKNANKSELAKMKGRLESVLNESGLKLCDGALPITDAGSIPPFEISNRPIIWNSPLPQERANEVAELFGLACGRKINETRLAFLEKIGGLPSRSRGRIWAAVQERHANVVLQLPFNPKFHLAFYSAFPGLRMDALDKVSDARVRKFLLPGFEKTRELLEKAMEAKPRK